MFPTSEVPVPKVAELPTCQATPQLEALLIKRTEEPRSLSWKRRWHWDCFGRSEWGCPL